MVRKLTRKSQMKFGKYEDCTVQNVLDIDPVYIVWTYYHSSNINYFEDILEELLIDKEFIIDKPSRCEETYSRWQNEKWHILFDTYQKRGMKRKLKYATKKDKQRNFNRMVKYQKQKSMTIQIKGNPR